MAVSTSVKSLQDEMRKDPGTGSDVNRISQLAWIFFLKVWDEREKELDKVRARGARAVNVKGLTAKELVLHLTLHGARTIERLARELQLEGEVLQGYVRALVKQGTLDLGRTNRGSTVVKLSGQE